MKVYKNLTELIADHKDVVYPDGNTELQLVPLPKSIKLRITSISVTQSLTGIMLSAVLTRRTTRVALFPSQTILQMQEGSQSVGMVRLMYSLIMVMNTGVSNL